MKYFNSLPLVTYTSPNGVSTSYRNLLNRVSVIPSIFTNPLLYYTYDLKVGPALTALATLMTTAGAGFIKRGATADTYTIDTNTYLTSYTETDTLATVTGRGASTTTNIQINNLKEFL